MKLENLAAITVTFEPKVSDGRLARQIRQLQGQVLVHLIVDNGGDIAGHLPKLIESEAGSQGSVMYVPLPENVGYGKAVNIALKKLLSRCSPDWVLLLDQDTNFDSDSFRSLHQELAGIASQSGIGLIGFNYRTHYLNRTVLKNSSGKPKQVRDMITSGSLIPSSVLASFPLDEDLYLYGVDAEYTRRLRRHGLRVLVLSGAVIDHVEGKMRKVGSASRWYLDPYRFFYVSRNSWVVFARYHDPKPLVYLVYAMFMNLLAWESPVETARFTLLGVISFLRGERAGPLPSRYRPSGQETHPT